MTKILCLLALSLCFAAYASVSRGQSPDGLWQEGYTSHTFSVRSSTLFGPQITRLSTDNHQLVAALADAPPEGSAQGVEFYYPAPDGRYLLLEVFDSSIMEPGLQTKYPQIRAYKVRGKLNPQISGRISVTPNGFDGYVNTPEGTVIIEQDTSVISRDTKKSQIPELYRVYYKGSGVGLEQELGTPFEILLHDEDNHGTEASENFLSPLLNSSLLNKERSQSSAVELKTLRLAMAMNGELTQKLGGSVGDGMEFIHRSLNRVNAVFERELALRLLLINNNDMLIYTDPDEDPYPDSVTLLTQANVANLNNTIGVQNYDIGHVLSGHGTLNIASLGQICKDNQKGIGTTAFPVGYFAWDARVVTYLGHELGHQLGARHTHNVQCVGYNAIHSTPVEVHAGSTIMSYAGLCIPTLQFNSDDMFHAANREEIMSHLRTREEGCVGIVEKAGVQPTIDAGPDYTIPANTPFVLHATAQDNDNNDAGTITYTWDQMDEGDVQSRPTYKDDLGNNALFRSLLPSALPMRYFPSLDTVLAEDFEVVTAKPNDTRLYSTGEIMPTTTRELNFRVTARSGSYGLAHDDVTLNVSAQAGPFKVLAPFQENIVSGNQLIVEWAVAGTDQPPVNCQHVDIELSVDNGNSFSYELAMNVPNDGGELVELPNFDESPGRIRVKCSDNIFYAVSPLDLEEPSEPEGSGEILIKAVEQEKNEGDTGSTPVDFEITREFSTDELSLQFQVQGYSQNPVNEGFADANDFVGGVLPSGVLNFAIGESSKILRIAVRGDQEIELDEGFIVHLVNVSNLLSPAFAYHKILNDDFTDEPPGTGGPGTGDPGTGDPGTGDPGTGDPGTGDPGTGDPGTGDPGTGDPGTGDPGNGDPGNGDPGNGDPGNGDPGNGDPGNGDPGTDDPDSGGGGGGAISPLLILMLFAGLVLSHRRQRVK